LAPVLLDLARAVRGYYFRWSAVYIDKHSHQVLANHGVRDNTTFADLLNFLSRAQDPSDFRLAQPTFRHL
jgi:hypothetical protein